MEINWAKLEVILLSPRERYLHDLELPGFQRDQAQQRAVDALQALYDQVVQRERRSWWTKQLVALKGRLGMSPPPELTGLYFWGGVGRGKTYLMDVFYESLPIERKMRTHFHRFMRRVHAELKLLKQQQDPLEKVAETLAAEAQVVCFDEFFVADITDAMILANLLKALFKRGVILVTTSNIPPAELYKDGLQRSRFLPAIALLERHTQVVNVDGGIDYRLRALARAQLYHTPLDAQARQRLEQFFLGVVPDPQAVHQDGKIDIEGRSLSVVKEAEDVVWFDFYVLCDGPRSQNDYIELAREYHAVIVENVPLFDGRNDDQARRFIYLVDEFYDRHVKLVLSAAQPIDQLYQAGRLGFEFARTVSRVQEMQSQEYLARAHRA